MALCKPRTTIALVLSTMALALLSLNARCDDAPQRIETLGPGPGEETIVTNPARDTSPVPVEARSLLAELDKTSVDEGTSARARKTLEGLARLQDLYTRSGRLDEAVAIRDAIASFRLRMAGVLPAPTNLTAYRGQIGRTLVFAVTGRTSGAVWGSQIYTDDSDIGTAAVHAGALKPGQKGVVRVTIFAGRDAYDGSDANGVASRVYGDWDGSFILEADNHFLEAHTQELPAAAKRMVSELSAAGQQDAAFAAAIDGLRRMQTASATAGNLDEALAVRGKIVEMIARRIGFRPDPGSLTEYRGQNGETFNFNVMGRTNGSVWGSGIYTDDSDLGTAAVHAGLLQPWQQGVVRVTILPGRPGYEASERNGVRTQDFGVWQGSYRLELVTKF